MYHIVHLEHLRLNITLLLPHSHHIGAHNYNFEYDHFVGLRNMHIENERIGAGLVYFLFFCDRNKSATSKSLCC